MEKQVIEHELDIKPQVNKDNATRGSKILAEIIRRTKIERNRTANWNQNWNQHTNKA